MRRRRSTSSLYRLAAINDHEVFARISRSVLRRSALPCFDGRYCALAARNRSWTVMLYVSVAHPDPLAPVPQTRRLYRSRPLNPEFGLYLKRSEPISVSVPWLGRATILPDVSMLSQACTTARAPRPGIGPADVSAGHPSPRRQP